MPRSRDSCTASPRRSDPTAGVDADTNVNDLDPTPSAGSDTPDEELAAGRALVAATTIAVLVVTAIAVVPAVAASATGTTVASPAKKPTTAPKRRTATPPALPKRCTELGIYRDDPIGTFPVARQEPRRRTSRPSRPTSPPATGSTRSWSHSRVPGGSASSSPGCRTTEPTRRYLPGYSLANITGGVLDNDLRALAGEMKAARGAGAVPADARAEHPVVRLVRDRQREHAGRVRARLEARPQGRATGRRGTR